MTPLLEAKDLTIFVKQNQTLIPVVKNISFNVNQGECVGIVGESGCGKSMTAHTVACLGNYPYEGSIKLHGENLQYKNEKEKREILAKQIGMIFQNPQMCLNPTMKIGEQIREVDSTA